MRHWSWIYRVVAIAAAIVSVGSACFHFELSVASLCIGRLDTFALRSCMTVPFKGDNVSSISQRRGTKEQILGACNGTKHSISVCLQKAMYLSRQ